MDVSGARAFAALFVVVAGLIHCPAQTFDLVYSATAGVTAPDGGQLGLSFSEKTALSSGRIYCVALGTELIGELTKQHLLLFEGAETGQLASDLHDFSTATNGWIGAGTSLGVAPNGDLLGFQSDPTNAAAATLYRIGATNGQVTLEGQPGPDGCHAWSKGSDGVMYGYGGFGSQGFAVFGIYPDGSGYKRLGAFLRSTNQFSKALAADGDDCLYATGPESVFRLARNGSSGRILHRFPAFQGDAQSPESLTWGGDGFVYGTASKGGVAGLGAIFRVRTDGSDYAVLHAFKNATNEGATPYSPLAMGSDGFLYGTSVVQQPRSAVGGFLFRINRNGDLFRAFGNQLPLQVAQPGANLIQGSDAGFYYSGLSGIARFSLTNRIAVKPPPTAVATNGLRFQYILPAGTFLNPPPLPPLAISAERLPDGVQFDAGAGTLSGLLPTPGRYEVLVTAVDPTTDLRSASVTVHIVVLPPQGSMMLEVVPGFDEKPIVRAIGVPGERYGLEYAPTLGGPWNIVKMGTADAAGVVEVPDAFGPATDVRFYRTIWAP
jgi:uncharacterized repeat protein (TIGR03803 family)